MKNLGRYYFYAIINLRVISCVGIERVWGVMRQWVSCVCMRVSVWFTHSPNIASELINQQHVLLHVALPVANRTGIRVAPEFDGSLLIHSSNKQSIFPHDAISSENNLHYNTQSPPMPEATQREKRYFCCLPEVTQRKKRGNCFANYHYYITVQIRMKNVFTL